MKFSGAVLDTTTAMSYKIVHETWEILFYSFELLFQSKPLLSAGSYQKALSGKICSSKGHDKYSLGPGLQDEAIRLIGHSVLPTDASYVT